MLGVKLVDGRGQALAFGGRVMKNVAGYDVSRLVAGSLGTLGMIAEVSLKLAPKPRVETTLRQEARSRERSSFSIAGPGSRCRSAQARGTTARCSCASRLRSRRTRRGGYARR